MPKEYAYRNDKGQEISVFEFHGFCTIGNGADMKTVKTIFDAEKELAAKGYTRKGFKDEQGVTRHALSRRKVEILYNQLMNFVADCTIEEYRTNEQAFTAIKTLLHQRMQ